MMYLGRRGFGLGASLACCMHIAQCLDALEPLMCGHVDQTGESIMLDCEKAPPRLEKSSASS